VRVIGATNQRLAARIGDGSFRADLYHRLKVIDIELPPLRTRAEDLVLLANAFLGKLGGSLGSDVQGFTPEAIDCMRRYSWPGNVRELRNVIERALILGRGSLIDRKDLPAEVATALPAPLPILAARSTPGVGGTVIPLPEAGLDLEKLERDLLFAALARAKGNKTAAARLLGLNRDQVRYRLKKLRGETGAPPAA
jgi:DNA-binding NtrC family response regulator